MPRLNRSQRYNCKEINVWYEQHCYFLKKEKRHTLLGYFRGTRRRSMFYFLFPSFPPLKRNRKDNRLVARYLWSQTETQCVLDPVRPRVSNSRDYDSSLLGNSTTLLFPLCRSSSCSNCSDLKILRHSIELQRELTLIVNALNT